MSTVAGKLVFICVGCIWLLGAPRTHATAVVTDAVVTDQVISQTAQTQNNVAVTFGQVFKRGDVPRGATLAATFHGQPVTLQVDAKATHPDGSLRHAVLTVMLPSLPGKATLPLVLSTQLPAQPARTATVQAG